MARKKKKQRSLLFYLLIAVLAVGAAVALYCNLILAGVIPDAIGRCLNGYSEEVDCPREISGIPVTTDLVNPDYVGRPGTKREIHYIVIHETDNTEKNATAWSHSLYIKRNAATEKKSWHYTVDDHSIYHHLPDNETAYHAGDNIRVEGGNRNGIGIELCVNEGGDFEQTMHNAAELSAYLMVTYDLELDAVKKHQDFSGKNCPSTIIENDLWDDFLEMVDSAYDARIEAAKQEEAAQTQK
ncbi:MAG: N-acetylmuramoyl-L-alanine amidase family protein [Butyricicoccaceae bacterium]